MRYKPERALTLESIFVFYINGPKVEMRYKPERALTHFVFLLINYMPFTK